MYTYIIIAVFVILVIYLYTVWNRKNGFKDANGDSIAEGEYGLAKCMTPNPFGAINTATQWWEKQPSEWKKQVGDCTLEGCPAKNFGDSDELDGSFERPACVKEFDFKNNKLDRKFYDSLDDFCDKNKTAHPSCLSAKIVRE